MTRKDYELIAGNVRSWDLPRDYKRAFAYDLADALRGTNPRFDKARFIKACIGE